MPTTFEEAFRTGDEDRDNFVARIFGIIGEEPVRRWGQDPRARYRDRGRPVILKIGASEGHRLDFTLDDGQGLRFVSEQKCWTAWQGGTLLRLSGPDQVRTTAKRKGPSAAAMRAFLDFAKNPTNYSVTCPSLKTFAPAGAILVWPIVTDEGRSSCMTELGFADVLALEDVVKDLLSWQSADWFDFLQRRRRGIQGLFDYLEGK